MRRVGDVATSTSPTTVTIVVPSASQVDVTAKGTLAIASRPALGPADGVGPVNATGYGVAAGSGVTWLSSGLRWSSGGSGTPTSARSRQQAASTPLADLPTGADG